MVKAVFLDRDGTLNHDPGYLGNPEDVQLLEGVVEALSILKNELGFVLIVISNQSGIARGFISKENVDAVNNRIAEILSESGISIDKFYYCPHHPEFSSEVESRCRKPSPEMVLKAIDEFSIDISRSYFIGDSKVDIECGINAGVKTILVQTGYGREHISLLHEENKIPNFVALNIKEAALFIKNDITGVN